MKERPILFSGPMVRAILEDRKTQTRRVAKEFESLENMDKLLARFPNQEGCPYGKPGDRMWVRETWQVVEGHGETESWEMSHIRWFEITGWPEKIPKYLPAGHYMRYAANYWTDDERDEMNEPYPWRSPIFMPRWASRITLEITGIRVERLQQISEADAMAEGISELPLQEGQPGAWWAADPWQPKLHGRSAIDAYRKLWESIHSPGSWDANPLVWVVEFRRLSLPTPPQQ